MLCNFGGNPQTQKHDQFLLAPNPATGSDPPQHLLPQQQSRGFLRGPWETPVTLAPHSRLQPQSKQKQAFPRRRAICLQGNSHNNNLYPTLPRPKPHCTGLPLLKAESPRAPNSCKYRKDEKNGCFCNSHSQVPTICMGKAGEPQEAWACKYYYNREQGRGSPQPSETNLLMPPSSPLTSHWIESFITGRPTELEGFAERC